MRKTNPSAWPICSFQAQLLKENIIFDCSDLNHMTNCMHLGNYRSRPTLFDEYLAQRSEILLDLKSQDRNKKSFQICNG